MLCHFTFQITMVTKTFEERRAAYMFHLGDQLKKTLDDESCDVILKFNNGEVKCHKNIMEAGCEKLKITAETCDNISRTAINVCNMSWLTVETGRELVYYIYTGSCNVTDENVVDILETSITWGVDPLTEECYIHMMQNCTTKNACLYLELELKHNHEVTHKYLLHFIREHYSEIRKLAALSDLRVSSLCDVIDHDEINVRSEDELLDSLMDLIEEKADAGVDADEPEPRYDVIRFEHVDTEYLIAVIRSHPLMSKNPQKKIVRDAIRYKYGKEDITNRRQKRYWGKRLMCIAKDKSVRAYCREEKEWQEMIKSVSWMDSWSSVQIYREGMVVVGAYNSNMGNKHVSYIDVKTGVVQELPDLPHGVWSAGVVCVEEEVFVLGGWSNGSRVNTTWKLVNKQQWEELPPLIHAVSSPVCKMHKDTIYVIGSGSNDSNKHVQSFNINTKTWTLKKQLPRGCNSWNSGVVIHADKLTVIAKDMMMLYDDVTDNWDVIKYNSITTGSTMTAMEHEGEICAYVETEQKVLQYDPQNNSWNLLADDVSQLCSMMLSVKKYC